MVIGQFIPPTLNHNPAASTALIDVITRTVLIVSLFSNCLQASSVFGGSLDPSLQMGHQNMTVSQLKADKKLSRGTLGQAQWHTLRSDKQLDQSLYWRYFLWHRHKGLMMSPCGSSSSSTRSRAEIRPCSDQTD